MEKETSGSATARKKKKPLVGGETCENPAQPAARRVLRLHLVSNAERHGDDILRDLADSEPATRCKRESDSSVPLTMSGG